jgi:predicted transcriptional regulator
MSRTVTAVTPRKLCAQSIYLEPERAELLDLLASETRIVKAVLLREAVDDLLVKYGKLKKPPNLKK